jgi:uncharacterized protein
VQGVPDRVVFGARDSLDFRPRGTQPLLERVGGVQHLGNNGLAASAAAAQRKGKGEGGHEGGQHQQEQGQGHASHPCGWVCSLPCGFWPGKFARRDKHLDASRRVRAGLTGGGARPTIPRLMSAEVPEVLDAWRMVAARRGFEGRVPLSSMTRLREALVDAEGEVVYSLEFDRDALQVPYVELRIEAQLPLQCQRSLERFLLPVQVVQRLGLLREDGEADEAVLPEGYEALAVPADGELRPAELVEDELILAVPVVAVKPGSESVERDWPVQPDDEIRANPFSVLAGLKKN